MKMPFGSTYLNIANLDVFISRQWEKVPGPTVIKAHEIGPAALAAIRTGAAKAICTFRDPRDCVASDIVFMGQGLDASLKRVVLTLEYLQKYQTTDHILLVRYEQMMENRRREIRRIADHLEIEADDELVNLVDARTNLEATKKVCQKLRFQPANAVLHFDSHRVDPETHLHENHISNAKIGRWKTELTPEQGRWLTEYFSGWLISLGYETQESLRQIITRNTVAPIQVPAANTGVFQTA